MDAPLGLTQRDLAIIRLVFDYEGVVAPIIRRRFFPTPGGEKPCYRRLRKLVDHGFLKGYRLPALSGVGSGKRFLTIGPRGRPLLAELLGVPAAELRRSTRAVA